MRVWWCNQSGQWDVERPNGVVCSHDSSSHGGKITYRKTVGDVKVGDLIVHYRKPRIVAFSRALEDGRYHKQLPLLAGEDYESGWRFKTHYFDLQEPLPGETFGKSLALRRVKHYPINRLGNVQQGYFFPFDPTGLAIVLSHVDEPLPSWLDAQRPGQPLLPEELDARAPLWEGATCRISVNAHERNPEARRRCIEHYGAKCVVCSCDLGMLYGKIAEGLIHVHHLKLISEIGESYKVDPIRDLRPVCPNCHAVIHLRSDPPHSIEEVKAFLRIEPIRGQVGR